jgi:carboxyl-terminal processing protease
VRGAVGSEVTLLVRRIVENGAAEELTFQVTRVEIETPSVEWRLIDDPTYGTRIGYIRPTMVTERSADEMKVAIRELNEQGADRFILDLSGNPGGLVTSAIAVADLWLDSGVLLIEQQANGGETVTEAQPGGEGVDLPLVVIVDGGSASASEIVAGAIQDNKRGVLVGERTFGKGSVQLIHELTDQSSLHVTYAQWLTPARHPITGHGLTPDVPVGPGEDKLSEAIAWVQKVTVAQAESGD